MRSVSLCILFSCCAIPVIAQKYDGTAQVKGRFVSAGEIPLPDLEVHLPHLKLMTTTDDRGDFVLQGIPLGKHALLVGDGYSVPDTLHVLIDKEQVDLSTIVLERDAASIHSFNAQLPTIALEESAISTDDEGISDQSISGVLSASRDPFMAAAAFTFGALRYQIRGYKRHHLEVYMNGLLMNDVETGSAFWSQWGGLNDVFRNQHVSFGLSAAEQGFGGLIGATQISATAAGQSKQTRMTYSFSNRSYQHRAMLTHSTGMLANGWALSVSVSRRWAAEGYIPGTFYDSYAGFLGLSRKLSDKSMLHLTVFGAPTQRGKAMPVTREAMELTGDNYYNPNWGYQQGKKRNARVSNTFQPLFLLHYEYRPNSTTLLQMAGSYQFGHNGNSAIDWYHARDPRPDYYRNLPSFYLYNPQGTDAEMAEEVRQEWLNNPEKAQVDWDRLYQANRLNYETVNGVSGLRSLYVIGEDRDEMQKYNFTAQLQKSMSEHLTLYGGLYFITQSTESYRKLLDLLGGDFYVNLNQFAERTYVGHPDFNQNDLNHPNSIVKEGDPYAYHYVARFTKGMGWGQAIFTYNKFDFFLSGRLTLDAFSREGKYKMGLFPDDSYGRSKLLSFVTYQAKGGITYKINGRHYLFVNGAAMTEAPTFDNTFYSPRTRHAVVDDIAPARIRAQEGGYLVRRPSLNGRLTAFVTDITNTTDIKRFYHEEYRSFVNYVMQHVGIRHLGGELALQAKLSPSLSATAVATWMQVFYTSRPDVHIYRDNDTNSTAAFSSVYLKNYYVAAGPQSAYTLGLGYRSPHYWYAYINASYVDRNYVDVNPTRRTAEAVDLLSPESTQWHQLLDQERLPAAFTLDVFAGKSFLLSKVVAWLPSGTYLYLNAGVNNILNNRNIITGGFEQLRYDFSGGQVQRFPAKYFYGYGTNYFLNVSLKF